MTHAQAQTATLSGWVVTNEYGDGTIRIAAKPSPPDLIRDLDPTDHSPSCFVRPDGSCGRVMTDATLIEEIRLRSLGVKVLFGEASS